MNNYSVLCLVLFLSIISPAIAIEPDVNKLNISNGQLLKFKIERYSGDREAFELVPNRMGGSSFWLGENDNLNITIINSTIDQSKGYISIEYQSNRNIMKSSINTYVFSVRSFIILPDWEFFRESFANLSGYFKDESSTWMHDYFIDLEQNRVRLSGQGNSSWDNTWSEFRIEAYYVKNSGLLISLDYNSNRTINGELKYHHNLRIINIDPVLTGNRLLLYFPINQNSYLLLIILASFKLLARKVKEYN